MNSHPYLRAYMAGIAAPTAFLMAALTVFILVRLVAKVDVAVERVLVFPMAVVPNAWGLWNVLFVRTHPRWRLGVHGMLLPLILIPAGFALALHLHVGYITLQLIALALPMALIVYYLLWKHLVGYLNGVLGLG